MALSGVLRRVTRGLWAGPSRSASPVPALRRAFSCAGTLAGPSAGQRRPNQPKSGNEEARRVSGIMGRA